MCGIVGYVGGKKVCDVLLDGLKKLEYRGYDSAGIAVMCGGKIKIVKAKGRLFNLEKKVEENSPVRGELGIGHTRWATHGEPNENNAHPHCNDEGTLVAVHNGIIENYAEQKQKLIRRGYSFYSDTDTEVATKLLDYYYKKHGDPIKAIASFALKVRGSYAIAVMFSDLPDRIYAVRKDSPMILGLGEGENFLASDVTAVINHTRKVIFVDNGEIACLTKDNISVCNLDGDGVEKQPVKVEWSAEEAERGGFEHFMIKEMHEQPAVVSNTLNGFINGGNIDISEVISDDELKSVGRVIIAACGSAYHVGVVMQYALEKLARMPVRVELASEFRYRDPILSGDELVVIISQSGETADSLAALRLAKERGAKTLAIVNVVGSSIAREADRVFYTKAGPEISVATTKAYSAQLIACYLLSVKLALIRGTIDCEKEARLIAEMQTLPDKIQKILSDKEKIQKFASRVVNVNDVFFIGRGLDYAVCLEGSLKLKEISYMHSEAYAAGELKHGPISLVQDSTLIMGVLTQGDVIEKTISNLKEAETRGGRIATVGFSPSPMGETFIVPETDGLFAASLAVIPLQLFAYYLSVLRGNDVDHPRNLAKSVTVE